MPGTEKPTATKTIGPGWSDDPAERERQVAEQESLVSKMAEIFELYDDYQLGDL